MATLSTIKGKIAAIYARVSTDPQEKEGTSLDTQIEAMLKSGQELNLVIPQDYRFREVFSGLTRERPLLAKVRELIRTRAVNVLIVYSLDRLARNPVDLIILVDELERANVELVCVTESLDSSDMGKLITHIKGYASKLEAEKIKERTVRGKRQIAREGKLPSGSTKTLGYDYDPATKTRVVNKAEAAVIQSMYYSVGVEKKTIHQVTRELRQDSILGVRGVPFPTSSVKFILRNPIYCGKTYAFTTTVKDGKKVKRPREEWIELPSATPAIIEPWLWESVQKQMRRNSELSRRNQRREYLLTGFVKCKRCGRSYSPVAVHKTRRAYRCLGRSRFVADPPCRNKQWSQRKLESLVLREFLTKLLAPHNLGRLYACNKIMEADLNQHLDDRLELAQVRLTELDKAQERLDRLYLYTQMSDERFARHIDHIKEQRSKIEKEIAELEARQKQDYATHSMLEFLQSNLAFIEAFARQACEQSTAERRRLMEILRVTVWIDGDNVEVEGYLLNDQPTAREIQLATIEDSPS